MLIQTFKLISNKVSERLTKEKFRTIVRDPDFQDFSLVLSTLTTLSGLIFYVFINDSPATNTQMEDMLKKLAETDQTVNEINQKVNKLIIINDTQSLNSQNEALVEELSLKVVEALKNQGLISQEGEIKSSTNSSNEIVQENMGIKSHYSTERIGFLAVIGILLLFVVRPTKALEIIENITNDN